MLDEKRSAPVTIRFRPSVRAAVETDRQAKGQPLAEWIERATLKALGFEDNQAINNGE